MDHLNATGKACKHWTSCKVPTSQRELVELSLRVKPAPKSARRFIERDRRSIPSR